MKWDMFMTLSCVLGMSGIFNGFSMVCTIGFVNWSFYFASYSCSYMS